MLGASVPVEEAVPVKTPSIVPVFVMVREPVASWPIFCAETLKMAPEPERPIERVPVANALDAIVTGVAVKFAYVPPSAPAEMTPTARTESMVFLAMRALRYRMCTCVLSRWLDAP